MPLSASASRVIIEATASSVVMLVLVLMVVALVGVVLVGPRIGTDSISRVLEHLERVIVGGTRRRTGLAATINIFHFFQLKEWKRKKSDLWS